MAIISNHPPKPVTFHNIVFTPNLASEKPYNINILKIPASAGVPTTNITYAAHRTLVSDIRGYEDKLSLEEDGIMYAPYISDVVPTYERASISAYSNAMVELLGKYVEAEKIFCYDMRVGLLTSVVLLRGVVGRSVREVWCGGRFHAPGLNETAPAK